MYVNTQFKICSEDVCGMTGESKKFCNQIKQIILSAVTFNRTETEPLQLMNADLEAFSKVNAFPGKEKLRHENELKLPRDKISM